MTEAPQPAATVLRAEHLVKTYDEGAGRVEDLRDVNLSVHAHEMVAMKSGSIYSAGTPSEVLTTQMVFDVFGLHSEIIPDPRTGVPLCLPYAPSGADPREARDDRPGDKSDVVLSS